MVASESTVARSTAITNPSFPATTVWASNYCIRGRDGGGADGAALRSTDERVACFAVHERVHTGGLAFGRDPEADGLLDG